LSVFIFKVAVNGEILFGFKVVSMLYFKLELLQPTKNNERRIRGKIDFLSKDILVHIVKIV
jgi:hypothetical protein